MNVPKEYKYSDEHVWVKVEGDVVTAGITEFAQNELGEIVFVELPEVGDTVEYAEPFGSLESVKTVSELYAPVTGEIVEINEALDVSPEFVNQSSFEKGWMIKIKVSDTAELDKLWTAEKYVETYSTDS
ncbi:glycine cleavage system protein GcvH [Longirhabdus pacifica]|uniref:glycine cleavage system protein GcvH n=1 Tax=Longirhabdus pacifica TaxID=2305227 RepID=UPI00100912DC|nr:glycine cleavage system protein GcvH [Longirhabdus pacifica]